VFTTPAEATPAGGPPPLVPLSRGPRTPLLVAFSTYVPVGGVQEYARLAASFRGHRDVAVARPVGFTADERLPADVDALLDAQAQAVTAFAGDRPVVLTGLSSGGTMAHAVAARLERRGAPVAGVALLDTAYRGEHFLDTLGDAGDEAMFDRERTWTPMTTARVTAAAWYLELFGGWEPPPLAAPVLLVRASEPVAPDAPDGWQVGWDAPHTAVDVPGDHFTIVEEHADTTAKAVEAWIAEL
jgi:polyketide synthase 12